MGANLPISSYRRARSVPGTHALISSLSLILHFAETFRYGFRHDCVVRRNDKIVGAV